MRAWSGTRSAAVCCLLFAILFASTHPAAAVSAPDGGTAVKAGPQLAGNVDARVNATADLDRVLRAAGGEVDRAVARFAAQAKAMRQGEAELKAAVRGAEVRFSPLTGGPEVVRGSRPLSAAAPGRAGFDVVRDFLHAHGKLYGLSAAEVDSLRFLGESGLQSGSGLRMVRVEQVVGGIPVFQSETRFLLDREGRIVRSVGLLVPGAAATAAAA